MNKDILPPIKWIRGNQKILIDLIQQLVQIPSVSGLELEIQKLVFKKLSELGLKPEYVNPDLNILRENQDFFKTSSFEKYGYENRPNVTTVLKGKGGGKSICLSGHIDVVSPEPVSHWKYDPWGGEFGLRESNGGRPSGHHDPRCGTGHQGGDPPHRAHLPDSRRGSSGVIPLQCKPVAPISNRGCRVKTSPDS